jgi:hypothetical protein
MIFGGDPEKRAVITNICAVHGCLHPVTVAGDICGYHSSMADKHNLRKSWGIFAWVLWLFRGK